MPGFFFWEGLLSRDCGLIGLDYESAPGGTSLFKSEHGIVSPYIKKPRKKKDYRRLSSVASRVIDSHHTSATTLGYCKECSEEIASPTPPK